MRSSLPSTPWLGERAEAIIDHQAVGEAGRSWVLVDRDEPELVDERELVDQARSDPDAFARLYRHYLPRIYAFSLRRCGSREVAEDITAVTFERALRNLASFRWERGGFGAWLFRIAANQVVDHHRSMARATSERGQRAHQLLRSADAVGPQEPIDPAERLRGALSTLNPRYQQALTLRYFADLDPADAAVACGLSSAHFAVVLHRARAALRKRLEEVSGDG